jgi:Zn finger protein HypA/HybF involved in hydrogenase expression
MAKKKENFEEDFPANQCRWCGKFLSFEEQEDGLCDSCYKRMSKVEPE